MEIWKVSLMLIKALDNISQKMNYGVYFYNV